MALFDNRLEFILSMQVDRNSWEERAAAFYSGLRARPKFGYRVRIGERQEALASCYFVLKDEDTTKLVHGIQKYRADTRCERNLLTREVPAIVWPGLGLNRVQEVANLLVAKPAIT